jgi:hypothetical protein
MANMMTTLEEVQKEIILCKEQLTKAPAIERRMHHLMGMEEILKELEEENTKPDLKVATK